jgi:hypothetical protein
VKTDYDLIQWLRDKVAKRGKNEKMYRQLLEMASGDEPAYMQPVRIEAETPKGKWVWEKVK